MGLRVRVQTSAQRRRKLLDVPDGFSDVLLNAAGKLGKTVVCRIVTPRKAFVMPNPGGIKCLAQLALGCKFSSKDTNILN
jgi:hypothetical protein